MARDWLKTLFRSSFKGVPFWVETDSEAGGRRIVKHVFPMRDPPFLEDLGEALREYSVTAYLVSDAADVQAFALGAVCSARGAGILVLPTHGPVYVRCTDFERSRSRDKHGYIAFSMKFTRDGFGFALASVPMLSNLIFVAAETAAAASAVMFASGFLSSGSTIAGAPAVDFVVEAGVSGLQEATAAFETVRITEAVDPIASAKQRDVLQTLYVDIPAALENPETVIEPAATVIAAARAIGDAMPPSTALRAFEEVLTTYSVEPPAATGTTRNAAAVVQNTVISWRLLRLAALTAYCEAVARAPLSDRPSAITLRANVAEFFETEIEQLTAYDFDLVRAITELRDAVITYLSRSILDLAPVRAISANLSLPSIYWAWRQYQDPARSTELVARNRVVHPSFMPTDFEALRY